MTSKILAAQLLPLQISTRPSSQKQGFAVFSSLPTPSFAPARISIASHFLSPALPRGGQSSPLIARSSSEETELAVEAEPPPPAAAEAEETVEEESADVEAEEKPPRKPIVKLGDIMGILDQRAREAAEKERPVPDVRPGDVVEIKLEVPENRRRTSTYKGIVISKQNAGIHTTIRIRRMIAGIGVEITFPVYSPNIKELKVVSHRKVRRAKLYYLKNKLPRLSTFK